MCDVQIILTIFWWQFIWLQYIQATNSYSFSLWSSWQNHCNTSQNGKDFLRKIFHLRKILFSVRRRKKSMKWHKDRFAELLTDNNFCIFADFSLPNFYFSPFVNPPFPQQENFMIFKLKFFKQTSAPFFCCFALFMLFVQSS